MDITTLRSMATVACLVLFLAIVAWAYARRNRDRFEEAAQLPFEQE